MSVELTTKFAPKTDELFKAESKISLLTNTDYDWTGAHAIKLYKINPILVYRCWRSGFQTTGLAFTRRSCTETCGIVHGGLENRQRGKNL